jgi:hypothetical protein
VSLAITCPHCDEDFFATDSADIEPATTRHATVCPHKPVRRRGTDRITCPDCGKALADIGKGTDNYEEQAVTALNLHTCRPHPRRTTMPITDEPPRRPTAQLLLTHPAKAVARQAAKVMEEEAKLTAAWRADLDTAKIRDEIAAKEAAIAKEVALLKKMKAQLRGGRATTGTHTATLPTTEIRTWAIANGYQVAASGTLPKAVIEAWQAATQQAAS